MLSKTEIVILKLLNNGFTRIIKFTSGIWFCIKGHLSAMLRKNVLLVCDHGSFNSACSVTETR